MSKKQINVLSIVGKIAVLLVLSSLIVGAAGAVPEFVEDRVFIGIDTDKISITEIVDESMIISDYGDLIPGTYLVRLPDGMTVPEAITIFSDIENVVFVEPDYYAHASDGETAASPIPLAGLITGLGVVILLARKR